MASRSPDHDPEQAVDELLAAPDSTRLSESERKKALARKAHLRAQEEQLRNSKRKELPSVEDVLADLVRVAEDPDVNPYHEDRTLSRKRYRRFGHWPIDVVDEMFGQFEHAKQVAGLEDQPGTRAKKAARAEASRREHAERYIERYVRPYVGDPCRRELTGTELVLSISDTHATHLDPFTWYAFLMACRDLKPDHVVANGDILDGSEISRHPKVPGRTVSLQLEFDFAREMFRQAREAAPDADLWWIGGNHGIDRIVMYLTQVAPAFANLRNLRFDKLAGVEEYGVQLAQAGTIASPSGTEDLAKGLLLHGWYRITHGTRLGQHPAMAELRDAARSGQSGHVHRGSVVYGTTETTAGLSWMTTPMGCTHRAGLHYLRGNVTGWQRGFGVAFLHPDGKVHQYPVSTEGGSCIVEGFEYEDPGFRDPDPTELWLKELRS